MERKSKIGISLSLSAIVVSILLPFPLPLPARSPLQFPGAGPAWAAISISATGTWSETVDQADLAGAPGSDLNGTYESAADQVQIDISGTVPAPPPDTWRVDIRKVDTTWDDNLHLYIQRTSDGTGPGAIMSGTSYQEVTSSYSSFFTGDSDRSDVHIQLKTTGVSVSVPSNAYSTTIYYTVVDTF